jgi:hypothetical protein
MPSYAGFQNIEWCPAIEAKANVVHTKQTNWKYAKHVRQFGLQFVD